MISTVKRIKICLICGDKANGFNFNVLTCESCKSFFRRNAYRYERIICRKGGNCNVDYLTRKCCARCRLEKCFQFGMKKELIWRHHVQRSNETLNQSNENSILRSNSLDSAKTRQLRNLPNINRILTKSTEWFREPFTDAAKTNTTSKTVLVNKFELSEREFGLIKEIIDANQRIKFNCFHCENDGDLFPILNDMGNLINRATKYITKTISFCKLISPFQSLTSADQLILLKNFFHEIMVIHIAFWHSELRQSTFPNACEIDIRTFHQELEQDPIIRDLMIGCRLFKPRNDLSCPEFITYQYHIYDRLLFRYLECKYVNTDKAAIKKEQLIRTFHLVNIGKAILEEIQIGTDSGKLSMVFNHMACCQ